MLASGPVWLCCCLLSTRRSPQAPQRCPKQQAAHATLLALCAALPRLGSLPALQLSSSSSGHCSSSFIRSAFTFYFSVENRHPPRLHHTASPPFPLPPLPLSGCLLGCIACLSAYAACTSRKHHHELLRTCAGTLCKPQLQAFDGSWAGLRAGTQKVGRRVDAARAPLGVRHGTVKCEAAPATALEYFDSVHNFHSQIVHQLPEKVETVSATRPSQLALALRRR